MGGNDVRYVSLLKDTWAALLLMMCDHREGGYIVGKSHLPDPKAVSSIVRRVSYSPLYSHLSLTSSYHDSFHQK